MQGIYEQRSRDGCLWSFSTIHVGIDQPDAGPPYFFLFLSVLYTPREACEPAICEKLRYLVCVSFLDSLLSIASLPDSIFFLCLPFWMCDFFDFDFDFSTSSCCFHPVYLVFFFWVGRGLLGFSGDLYRVPTAII